MGSSTAAAEPRTGGWNVSYSRPIRTSAGWTVRYAQTLICSPTFTHKSCCSSRPSPLLEKHTTQQLTPARTDNTLDHHHISNVDNRRMQPIHPRRRRHETRPRHLGNRRHPRLPHQRLRLLRRRARRLPLRNGRARITGTRRCADNASPIADTQPPPAAPSHAARHPCAQ